MIFSDSIFSQASPMLEAGYCFSHFHRLSNNLENALSELRRLRTLPSHRSADTADVTADLGYIEFLSTDIGW